MMKRNMMEIHIATLFSMFFLFYSPLCFAGQATLSWFPPETNEDGTPLTDLAGYIIFYGTASGSYTKNINVGNTSSYTVTNLKEGYTYFFTVTAFDTSFNQSRYSNIVSKSIPGPKRYSLTIYSSGTGFGTITSSPAGINCGSICGFSYPILNVPTKVTLKALADSNSYFVGWEGDCVESKPTCTLTLDRDSAVAAIFVRNPILSVAKSGDGKGVILATPEGVNCGVDCSSHEVYLKYKDKVTLRAKTDEYSTFLGWGGDCEDHGILPTCTLRMDANKSVNARFGLPNITVTQGDYYFGSVAMKESSIPALIALCNSGIGNLKIKSVRLIGSDKKMFKIVGAKKTTIAPGDSYEYTIFFKPSATGFKEAVLEIMSNDPDTPVMNVILQGFGCTDRTDMPRVKKCNGALAQCLSMQCGWEFEGVSVGDSEFRDASVVRLPDGRYRMYGDYSTVPGVIDSWISDGGIMFEKEPGSRLTGQGIMWPSVVMLPDGRFRMYFTEQSRSLNVGCSAAIKSAISADGLNFFIESGERLACLGSGYESDSIRNAKILPLEDGSYRMYYSALSNDVYRVLSAVSSDGLNWFREHGVRLDPQTFCPANTHVIGPSDSFIDIYGVLHQYIWTITCKNYNYKDAIIGLFELTSIDGLTFDIGKAPVVAGYYFKGCYGGRRNDPGVHMDNAPVVSTPEGLRAYLFIYEPEKQCADWTGGYHSILNTNIR